MSAQAVQEALLLHYHVTWSMARGTGSALLLETEEEGGWLFRMLILEPLGKSPSLEPGWRQKG